MIAPNIEIDSPYAILQPMSHSVGMEGERISEFMDGIRKDWTLSFYRSSNIIHAQNVLDEFFARADKDNWDGEDALPVKGSSYAFARQFLEAMPSWWSAPAISADPDGELTLEWYAGPSHRVSISIGPDSWISAAWLMGSTRGVLSQPFAGDIPRQLSDAICKVIRA